MVEGNEIPGNEISRLSRRSARIEAKFRNFTEHARNTRFRQLEPIGSRVAGLMAGGNRRKSHLRTCFTHLAFYFFCG